MSQVANSDRLRAYYCPNEAYRAYSTSHSPAVAIQCLLYESLSNESLQSLLYESFLSEWKLTEPALRVIWK